jgi:hypothetical protein
MGVANSALDATKVSLRSPRRRCISNAVWHCTERHWPVFTKMFFGSLSPQNESSGRAPYQPR